MPPTPHESASESACTELTAHTRVGLRCCTNRVSNVRHKLHCTHPLRQRIVLHRTFWSTTDAWQHCTWLQGLQFTAPSLCLDKRSAVAQQLAASHLCDIVPNPCAHPISIFTAGGLSHQQLVRVGCHFLESRKRRYNLHYGVAERVEDWCSCCHSSRVMESVAGVPCLHVVSQNAMLSHDRVPACFRAATQS